MLAGKSPSIGCVPSSNRARYQHERGVSSEAVVYYDIAQSICESLKWTIKTINNSPISEKQVDAILAELNHNRGCIATETNCPKDALKYHSQFNAMMLKEISNGPQGTDWRLGISWNQLGTAKMINELWEEGEDCFKRSIHQHRFQKKANTTSLGFIF